MLPDVKITADDWLRNNPYVLPMRYGHVLKSDMLNVIGMPSHTYRRHIEVLCDSDPNFAKQYESLRQPKYLPMALAEYIIKQISANPNCSVQFERVGNK